MKKLLQQVLIASVLMMSAYQSFATHLMGGDITYTLIAAPSTYNIKLTLYRDCAGIPAPTNPTLTIKMWGTQNIIMQGAMYISAAPVNVSNLCPAAAYSSYCNGGSLYGMEKWEYSAQLSLPLMDMSLEYIDCCRNCAITNLVNACNYGWTIRTHMDLATVMIDNSPNFVAPPVMIVSTGMPTNISWNASDVDGDSLTYHLVSPLDDYGYPIQYTLPCSYMEPFIAVTPTTLDSTTGVLSINPNGVQITVVTIQCDEYRNDSLIGSVLRDVQIAVMPQSNQQPYATGINGTNTYTISTCPGFPVNFNINAADPDSGQIVTISWNNGIDSAVFTPDTALTPTANFAWTPDSLDVSPLPHTFTVTVTDDYCPYTSIQVYSFNVYVNQCNTSDVWPGDANADYAVDVYDILPIAIAYGNTGYTRPGANLTWTAQTAADWNDSLPSGINYKHADCDGNGLVDSSDAIAIGLNYGSTHLRKGITDHSYNRSVPSITVDLPTCCMYENTQITLPVILGDATTPVNGVYGVAFSLNIDAALFVPGTLSFSLNNASMFNNSQVLQYQIVNGNTIEAVIAKTNHQNVSGNTVLGYITFTAANIPATTYFQLYFTNVEMVDSSGNSLALNMVNQNLLLESTDGINTTTTAGISVFPNPANETVTVSGTISHNATLKLVDVLGRVMLVQNISAAEMQNGIHLNTKNICNGLYELQIIDGQQKLSSKITISH